MNNHVFSEIQQQLTMLKIETYLNRFVIVCTSFVTLFLSSCSKNIDIQSVNADAVSSEAVANDNKDQLMVPNELLVKFKPGVSQAAKNKLLSRISATVAEKILTKTMQLFNDKEGVLLLHTPLAALEARNKIQSEEVDRKSTRLNSSHLVISYAVFCLKKK